MSGALKTDLALAKNPTERRVGGLLKRLGLGLVGVDVVVPARAGRAIGEVDLIFRFEDVILLAEVTHRAEADTDKIDHFFSRWLDARNMETLRNLCDLPPLKVVRVFFEMNQSRPDQEPDSLGQYLQRSPEPCAMVYKDDFEYFDGSFVLVGQWAVNDFLAFVGWPKGGHSDKIPAIQFYLGDRHAYSFAVKASRLLRSSYIYRRLRRNGRVKDLGYQRALDPNRMRRITQYVVKTKSLAFPNSIILSCDSKLLDVPRRKEECPMDVQIHLPTDFCANRIVDGQHRVYAFSQLNKTIQDAYYLPVVAFDDLDPSDEIALFTDINSTQKRVDRNLILTLRMGFQWPLGSRESYEETAVQICKKLSEAGALRDRVYFGGALEKREGNIKLATLVAALLQSNLIGGKLHLYQESVDDVEGGHQRISADFEAMVTSSLSAEAKNFFLSNQGVRVMTKALQILERNRRKQIVDVRSVLFFQSLGHIMDRALLERMKILYGEGGASKALDLMFNSLQRSRNPLLRRNRQALGRIQTNLKSLRIRHHP